MHRLLLGLVVALFASAVATAERPPNIVFILIDDLGWADLGCHGNHFNETKNIDSFAQRAVRFTDFYAAGAVCSPTRASILSGQYPTRFGLTAHIHGHWRPFAKLAEPPCALAMPVQVVTIAERLQAAGYTTAHFGKWHLGGRGHQPTDQGFDTALVTPGRHNYQAKGQPPRRLAEHLTETTIDFMRRHREQPFFVHLCHYAVHIPLNTTPELLAKYQAKPAIEGYPSNPTYAGLLEEVDQSVGRILKALDDLQLEDNTLVVVTSDNGGLVRRYNAGPADPIVTSNAPLRDEKGSLYEGGIRVPLLIRYPSVTPAGRVCAEPTISVDFYPTLLQVAGLPPTQDQPCDGASLLPLMGEPGSALKRQALYWHYPHYHHSRPASAIRVGDWKAIDFFDTKDFELYSLQEDPSESTDRAAQEPAKAAELRSLLRSWRAKVNAQVPQANPAYRPRRAQEWWSRARIAPIPLRP